MIGILVGTLGVGMLCLEFLYFSVIRVNDQFVVFFILGLIREDSYPICFPLSHTLFRYLKYNEDGLSLFLCVCVCMCVNNLIMMLLIFLVIAEFFLSLMLL